jgi:hypothetical protein
MIETKEKTLKVALMWSVKNKKMNEFTSKHIYFSFVKKHFM